MKRTTDDWNKLLDMRRERLHRLLNLKAPVDLIVTECKLVLAAYYRREVVWTLRVFLDLLRSSYENWKAHGQYLKWRKQGLSDEQIKDKLYGDKNENFS